MIADILIVIDVFARPDHPYSYQGDNSEEHDDEEGRGDIEELIGDGVGGQISDVGRQCFHMMF